MADAIYLFEKAQAFVLTLPGTLATTTHCQPAVASESNGRTFLNAVDENAPSFLTVSSPGMVVTSMATEPVTYWQSSHYAVHPAVLVQHASPDPD